MKLTILQKLENLKKSPIVIASMKSTQWITEYNTNPDTKGKPKSDPASPQQTNK